MTIINATTSTGGRLSGDQWSPQGKGDGTTSITYSIVEQTFALTGTGKTFSLWFTGSDTGRLVHSAFITQGAKSTPITMNGHTSFIVPPAGRWSDFASIADFTIPGDIKCIINYASAVTLPTFSNEPVPNTPVPVSAVEEGPRIDQDEDSEHIDPVYPTGTEFKRVQGTMLLDCEFEGTLNDKSGIAPTTSTNISATTEWSRFGSGSAKINYAGSSKAKYSFNGVHGSQDIVDDYYALSPEITEENGTSVALDTSVKNNGTSSLSFSGTPTENNSELSFRIFPLDLQLPIDMTFYFRTDEVGTNNLMIMTEGISSDEPYEIKGLLWLSVMTCSTLADTSVTSATYNKTNVSITTVSGFSFTPGETVIIWNNKEGYTDYNCVGTVVSCSGTSLVVNVLVGYLGWTSDDVEIAHRRNDGYYLQELVSSNTPTTERYAPPVNYGAFEKIRQVITSSGAKLYINDVLEYDLAATEFGACLFRAIKFNRHISIGHSSMIWIDDIDITGSGSAAPGSLPELEYPMSSLYAFNTFSLSLWTNYALNGISGYGTSGHILISYNGVDTTFLFWNGSIVDGAWTATKTEAITYIGTVLNLLINSGYGVYDTYIDALQLIGGYYETEIFTMPSAPYEVYGVALDEVTKSGDITINTNPSPGETFTVSNSATTVFTFVDHYPNNATEIQIGATTVVTAQALATAINNISGAEFVATVDGSIISVDAYCESAFTMTTTSTGIEISSITEIVPGLITEIATAADSFTASDGGKAVQENATAADSTDGLIDEITEAASVSTVFDTLNVEMDETIEATVVTDFDGLIEYMGEEI